MIPLHNNQDNSYILKVADAIVFFQPQKMWLFTHFVDVMDPFMTITKLKCLTSLS